jgi:hypothetical protein
MNRRTFIGTSIATAVVVSRPAWTAEHRIQRVGLQLYTVRDLMKQDFEGTIAKVAQTGYKEVEFAGYFGKSPQEVRKILDANKLVSPSEHVPYDAVEKKWSETTQGTRRLEARCRTLQPRRRSRAEGRHSVRLSQSRF